MQSRFDPEAGLDVLLLAAGFGTRLRPLTEQIPKALLPICGVPLLDRHLAHLLGPGETPTGCGLTGDDDRRHPRIRSVVINGHHLADQIAAHIDHHSFRERIVFSHEPEILGTGGAIAKAAEFLRSDPFVVINADTLFPAPIAEAVAHHRAGGFLATMVLVPAPRWASVCAREGAVTEIRRTPHRTRSAASKSSQGAETRGSSRHTEDLFTFTGCHVISRQLLQSLPKAVFHDIIKTYEELIHQQHLGAFISPLERTPFLDVGTPTDYLAAHRLCAGADAAAGSFIDASACVGEGCRIEESVVMRDARVAPGSRIRRCIVGPGAIVAGEVSDLMITTIGTREIALLPEEAGREREAGEAQEAGEPAESAEPRASAEPPESAEPREPGAPDDLRQFVDRALPLLVGHARDSDETQPRDPRARPTLLRLAGDGSTRQIFRVSFQGTYAVAVANPLAADRSHPDENEGFLAVREYLHRRNVRVPAFYAADLEKGLMLLEDLGDTRLYDLWHMPGRATAPARGNGPVEALYEEAIRSLVLMQAPGNPAFDPRAVSNPAYTREFILDFEARYFHDELVRGLMELDHSFDMIAPECRWLADEALGGSASAAQEKSAASPVFMHRDFQSRNLMVSGSAIAVIDFQGARRGPPEYDLASLLYDPYTPMPEPLRASLLDLYLREASRAGVPGVPRPPLLPESPGVPADGASQWQCIFLANAANRLMQALGAFAKLGGRRKRDGFLEHVPAGLSRLEGVLQGLRNCPNLHSLVRMLPDLWAKRPR